AACSTLHLFFFELFLLFLHFLLHLLHLFHHALHIVHSACHIYSPPNFSLDNHLHIIYDNLCFINRYHYRRSTISLPNISLATSEGFFSSEASSCLSLPAFFSWI